MAAFTSFTEEALKRYLVMFGRGELAGFSAITSGIENSNYFVHLDKDGQTTEFVLTIMEEHSFAEVPFFNKVLTRLHHYGLPVAAPQTTLDGMSSTIFCGKPTFLFKRLPGEHPESIDTEHCMTLGQFIASLHKALDDMPETRNNPYDLVWMQQSLAGIEHLLSGDDKALLNSLVQDYEDISNMALPRGLIHGDLFRDNALFAGGSLTGVIDFYHACEDMLVQDLAIAINDWCTTPEHAPDKVRRTAMIAGYESVRELTADEHDVLLRLQQVSAARFALTRFQSGDPPLKDPGAMLNLARQLQRV